MKASLGVADDYADADGLKVLSYGQAQRMAIAWEREATERPTGRGFTVADAMSLWWDDYEGRARSQIAVNEQRYKRDAVVSALGNLKVAKLSIDQISSWLGGIVRSNRVDSAKKKRKTGEPLGEFESREAKRKRQATANRLLSTLKAGLNHAWKSGRVNCDPVWRKVEPFRGADQPRLRYLTLAEVGRLIEFANADFRPLIRAAVLTGCRWGEVRSMRVSDFDSRSKTVVITHTKGGRDRRVPLTEEGVRHFLSMTAGRSPTDFIFKRADGGLWGVQDQKRPMLIACAASKIVPAVGFHVLRHTYGSLLAQAGASMAVIAAAMGHADSRMTERHYAHLSPGHVAAQIRQHLPEFGFVN